MLVAAVFFGYMLALLQRRVRAMFSSEDVSYLSQVPNRNSQHYPNSRTKIFFSQKVLNFDPHELREIQILLYVLVSLSLNGLTAYCYFAGRKSSYEDGHANGTISEAF